MIPKYARCSDNGPELNDSGTYTTAAGDIETGTVEYVLDLLNRSIDNPNNTVSKGKLKHIAAQLLARNALLERKMIAMEAELKVYRNTCSSKAVEVVIDGGYSGDAQALVDIIKSDKSKIRNYLA